MSSFLRAPIATRVPSEDIDTEYPDWSLAASPSMSEPTWDHDPLLSEYTRTWPASPSLPRAPIATRVPSEDIDTDHPDSSLAASPSMSEPTWDHAPDPSAKTARVNTRTWPELEPLLPSLRIAPIATRVPSEDIDTECPNWSSAASPSISWPTWVHREVPLFQSYTRTWPELEPLLLSLRIAPIATRVPSEDIDTEVPE